jgi:hypothetical protein
MIARGTAEVAPRPAFIVRAADGGPYGEHARRPDAVREAQQVAASGGRFVVVMGLRSGAVEAFMPSCLGPGPARDPLGFSGCGRGDVGESLWCPEHAASHHPAPRAAACPRCAALAGEECVAVTGSGEAWRGPDGQPRPVLSHEERHAAAIALDGRTCATWPGQAVTACQDTLF